MILKQWEARQGKVRYFFDISEKEVLIGETTGNPHTEAAGACSHQEFLEDHMGWQALVRARFGEAALKDALRICRLEAGSGDRG